MLTQKNLVFFLKEKNQFVQFQAQRSFQEHGQQCSISLNFPNRWYTPIPNSVGNDERTTQPPPPKCLFLQPHTVLYSDFAHGRHVISSLPARESSLWLRDWATSSKRNKSSIPICVPIFREIWHPFVLGQLFFRPGSRILNWRSILECRICPFPPPPILKTLNLSLYILLCS